MIRLRVPRVLPLEIWQLILRSGVPLSRAIRQQPEDLLEGLFMLHRGEGQTRGGRADHHVCAGYQQLVIGGGRATPALDAVLSRGPTPFTRLDDPFLGEAGGLSLAARSGFGPEQTLVLDLGGTSIKVSYAGRRCRLERDLDRLPKGPSARQRPDQRERLRDFLAEAIDEAIAGRSPPRAIVFALPGEIADDGSPGRSTYAGTHPALLPDVLARVGLEPELVGVLNDAELAAASAALLPEAAAKTLVLTLGFGVGAALLRAEPEP